MFSYLLRMSLESALDEERREVMRLLEGRPLVPKAIARTSAAGRSASPVSAQSPVRSMLDIGVGITNPQRPARAAPVQAIRSMLDTSTPAPPPAATVNISPLSPNQAVTPATTQSTAGQRLDPETAYQFEMLPTVEAYALPKRVTQGGKLPRSQPLLDPGGSGSGSMPRARSSKSKSYKSTSPSSRLPSGRPISPGGRRLNTNSLNLMSDPGVFVTDSGKSVDMQTAYRRLSDAALLRSGGSLSVLANRRTVDAKGEAPAPGGGTRLHEDYYSPSEGPALDSSDDSDDSFTGKSRSADRRRGRRLTRNRDDNKRDDSDSQSSPDGRRPKSLLAAAEEESASPPRSSRHSIGHPMR